MPSDDVDGLPAWGDDVTIEHLMHHASGIPDYVSPMLDDEGYKLEDPVKRQAILKTIAGMKELDFKPGTDWQYSNSNYVLLGYAIEEVSDCNRSRGFSQTGLPPLGSGSSWNRSTRYQVRRAPTMRMRLNTTSLIGIGTLQGQAASRAASPILIRWGDNYRTGKVGGQPLLDAQVADAVESDEGALYGAGIEIRPNGSLYHDGGWERFPHSVQHQRGPNPGARGCLQPDRRSRCPQSAMSSARSGNSARNVHGPCCDRNRRRYISRPCSYLSIAVVDRLTHNPLWTVGSHTRRSGVFAYNLTKISTLTA